MAYLLVVGSTLLPFGRLGEVLTFKRVYLAGFAVFTIASILCGAAPTAEALVAFRIVQGVGAGMLQAMGPAIVARTFGPHERGRALGLNAISVSIGLSVGPALGGLLTEFGTWRAIFFVNAPVGLIAILWAARVLPNEQRGSAQSFDLRGALLSGAALFALLLALSDGQTWGWTSPQIILLLLAFAVLGTGFVVGELRARQPMLDLTLFRIRAFAAGNATVIVAFSGLFTATFLLPFLLGERRRILSARRRPAADPGADCDRVRRAVQRRAVGPHRPARTGQHRHGHARPRSGQPDPTADAVRRDRPRLAPCPHRRRPGPLHEPEQQRGARLGAPLRLGTASGTLAQMRINGQALGSPRDAAVVAIRQPVHAAAATAGSSSGAAAQAAGFLGAVHDAFPWPPCCARSGS